MATSDQVKSYKLAQKTYHVLFFALTLRNVIFPFAEPIIFIVLIISIGLNKTLLIKCECMNGCSSGISYLKGVWFISYLKGGERGE